MQWVEIPEAPGPNSADAGLPTTADGGSNEEVGPPSPWITRRRLDTMTPRLLFPSRSIDGHAPMRWLISCLIGLAVTSVAPVDDPKPPDGFTALFDGKSLRGWRMVNTTENFLVRDHVLVMNKGAGWLATEKSFTDFELRVRCRFVTPGADSGIFIRSALEGTNWTSKGYQVQNMDNETMGMVVGMGVPVKVKSHKPELVKRIKKPSGEWNDMVIVAKGKHVDVTLNGELVAQSDSLDLPEGHIGLQAEGGILEFQRIDIKPLGRLAD
jgi:hypothetical protein